MLSEQSMNDLELLKDIKIEMAHVLMDMSQATAIEQDPSIEYLITSVEGIATSIVALVQLLERQK